MYNSISKFAVWILIVIIFFIFFRQFDNNSQLHNIITYTQFMEQAKSGNISNIETRKEACISSKEFTELIKTVKNWS